MIELFTADTPNGIKIPIALEELGAPYVVRMMKLGSPELRSPEFAQVNPNGKIPAIRHPGGEGGAPITVFESGAILLHLGERFGGLLGATPQARAQTLSWLFLQVAGLGPALGAAGHFRGLSAPDPYASERFRGEAARLLGLLEQRVREAGWLNGEDYSVADITGMIAVDFMKPARIAMPEGLANVRRWHAAVSARRAGRGRPQRAA